MTSKKEKDILLALLNKYRDMPHLWQKTHKEYMNRDKREIGFAILLKIYREFDEHATIKYLKKKVENMRTSYIRELRKVNRFKGIKYRCFLLLLVGENFVICPSPKSQQRQHL